MDFSISLSIPAAFAAQGRAMFKKSGKQSKVRVVAALFPLHLGFYVRNDSPIKTIADLKGKRLGDKYPKQRVIKLTGSAKLATAGLTRRGTNILFCTAAVLYAAFVVMRVGE